MREVVIGEQGMAEWHRYKKEQSNKKDGACDNAEGFGAGNK